MDELHEQYAQAMRELDELGVSWIEAHASGRATQAISDEIVVVDKLTRKLERKLRKRRVQHGG